MTVRAKKVARDERALQKTFRPPSTDAWKWKRQLLDRVANGLMDSVALAPIRVDLPIDFLQ